jgi:hypothetical protein
MSATNNPATCSRCAFTLPAEARFCPKCGEQVLTDETIELPLDPHLEKIRTAEQELPARLGRRPRASVHQIERRRLGVAPVPLLGGLALTALILAIVLWSTVGSILGLGLLIVSLALFGLFLAGVRRQPESPISQALLGLAVRARDLLSFLISTFGTWTRAGREVASLRARRLRLRRELQRRLTPLGEAVHLSDAARAEELKAELAELQQRLEEASHQESAVLEAAHSTVERERTPVQPTEVFAAVSPRPDDGSGSSDGEP